MTIPPEPQPPLATLPSVTPTADSMSRPPKRLGWAIAIINLAWIIPFVAGSIVLLPARFGQLDPTNKVQLVASVSIVGAIVSLLANVLFGALSDRLRSRFGRRTPFIVAGSIGAFVSLLLVASAPTISVTIVFWLVFQAFINALIAGLVAIIPDRVPESRQGTYSAVYGISLGIGGGIGSIFAGLFVTAIPTAFVILSFVSLIAIPAVFLAREASNAHQPRPAFDARSLLVSFAFPVKGARDFYLAALAKLLFVVAAFSISGFQLFILTDFVGTTAADAGKVISITGGIGLLVGLVVGAVVGPLSDRLRRRKAFVMAAAIVIAGSLVVVAVAHSVPAMFFYTIVGGAGLAAFNAIDQAVNYEVLPSESTAAKDLGVLNVANTGGQILGPGIAGIVIATGLGYVGLLWVMAGVLVLSALVFIPIKRVR